VAAASVFVGNSILVELEFDVLIFVEGGKSEKQEKNPYGKEITSNKQTQTQLSYGTRPESKPGHISKRQVISQQHHPCSYYVFY